MRHASVSLFVSQFRKSSQAFLLVTLVTATMRRQLPCVKRFSWRGALVTTLVTALVTAQCRSCPLAPDFQRGSGRAPASKPRHIAEYVANAVV